MYELLLLLLCFIAAYLLLYICRCKNKIIGGAAANKKRNVAVKDIYEKYVNYYDPILEKDETYDTQIEKYKSYDQIKTIANRGSIVEKSRLIQLVGKFYKHPIWDLVRLLSNPDDVIYQRLDPIEKNPERDYKQALAIYRILQMKVDSFLDLGCAQGGITENLKKLLNAKKAYGTDVFPLETSQFEYFKLDKVFPLKNASLDLVVASMVLHHIEDLNILKEVARVIKPGKYFFLKEHDCWNAVDAMLIDIEHKAYDARENVQGDYAVKHYKNYKGWDEIIQSYGFKLLRSDYFYIGLKNEMSPTRAYWALYQKI